MTIKLQSIIITIDQSNKGDVVMTLEEFLEKMRKYEEQPKIWTVDPVREK